jgi:hypothetical protein
MLIKTETTLALRCLDCGRSTLETVSRFGLSRGKSKEVLCSCGRLLLVIGSRRGLARAGRSTKNRKSYWLEINCVICEANHLYHLTPGELWTRSVVNLSCLETGLELGCIGPYEQVRACLQTREQALGVLVEEMGGPSYFRDAEIMLATLTHVHTLAEEGSLSCSCGKSRIELEIFPDRIELHCRHCLRMCILPAEGKQDLAQLEACESIELTGQVFNEKKRKAYRRKHDNHRY